MSCDCTSFRLNAHSVPWWCLFESFHYAASSLSPLFKYFFKRSKRRGLAEDSWWDSFFIVDCKQHWGLRIALFVCFASTVEGMQQPLRFITTLIVNRVPQLEVPRDKLKRIFTQPSSHFHSCSKNPSTFQRERRDIGKTGEGNFEKYKLARTKPTLAVCCRWLSRKGRKASRTQVNKWIKYNQIEKFLMMDCWCDLGNWIIALWITFYDWHCASVCRRNWNMSDKSGEKTAKQSKWNARRVKEETRNRLLKS